MMHYVLTWTVPLAPSSRPRSPVSAVPAHVVSRASLPHEAHDERCNSANHSGQPGRLIEFSYGLILGERRAAY
jgi:hypothetical protein